MKFCLTILLALLGVCINAQDLEKISEEIENFNVLAKEPIVGKKLTISALMLSVSAYVNKSTLLLNDGILTQHYSDAISFKSYDYFAILSLGFINCLNCINYSFY